MKARSKSALPTVVARRKTYRSQCWEQMLTVIRLAVEVATWDFDEHIEGGKKAERKRLVYMRIGGIAVHTSDAAKMVYA